MSQVFLTEKQQRIHLGPELGGGGEGHVYEIIDKLNLVAKIYKATLNSQERETKLQAMVANPPLDPMKDRGHISMAWPTDLLYDQNKFIGYLMPRIQQAPPVFALYHPKERVKLFPGFNTRYLLAVAKNIAIALEALHEHNYVFGDFNESNILVAHNALVTFIDTDSYQVTDHQGNIHRCPVGKPEFTPPELQGQDLKSIIRSPTHDQFGLAVMIFYLLMEGYHPFQGKVTDSSLSISQVDLYCIKHGIFPYQENPQVSPSPNSPRFEILQPNLQKLFIRCFVDGYNAPTARPSPQEWQAALEQAKQSLRQCKRNREHYYSSHLKKCPWCEREMTQKVKSDLGVQEAMPLLIPTPSSPPPTPQSSPTPLATSTSSPKPTGQLLSFAEWRDSIKKPSFIGALSGLPVTFVIWLMFERPDLTSAAIGIVTAIAIITVAIYIAVKISSVWGRFIFVGGGFIGGAMTGISVSNEVFLFLFSHQSTFWLYVVSILFCTLIGIAIGNYKLLPRLNYSIAGIFLSVSWLLLPITFMWSIGFFSKLVEPKFKLTPVVVTSTPETSTTPTPRIIETSVNQAADTLESTQEHIPTNTSPIFPTKTTIPEVATSTTSEINEMCIIYVVQLGDSISKIAKSYLGDSKPATYSLIVVATQKAREIDPSFAALPDPSRVEVGDKLCVPKTFVVASGLILPSTPSASLPLPVSPPTSTPTKPGNCSDSRSIITSPVDGAIIRDVVPFMGTASLDNLKYYKFEYRPTGESEWRFLTKLDGASVNNNKLMDWHTYTVNPGTYDIRLTVVDVTENYLQRCEIQVTITR